jgi:hypothetical protein
VGGGSPSLSIFGRALYTLLSSCLFMAHNRRWLGLTTSAAPAAEGGGKGRGGERGMASEDGGSSSCSSSGSGSSSKAEADFRAVAGSAMLAMGEWGTARALALSWLDSLASWLEASAAWPAAEKATLRMDEVGWGVGRGWVYVCMYVRDSLVFGFRYLRKGLTCP